MSVSGITSNTAPASSGTTSSSSDPLGGDMDTTFMQLLTTELTTQDPTSPMDASTMVSQMVSLNQLDQLIAIHQLMLSPTGAASTSGATNPNPVNGGN